MSISVPFLLTNAHGSRVKVPHFKKLDCHAIRISLRKPLCIKVFEGLLFSVPLILDCFGLFIKPVRGMFNFRGAGARIAAGQATKRIMTAIAWYLDNPYPHKIDKWGWRYGKRTRREASRIWSAT